MNSLLMTKDIKICRDCVYFEYYFNNCVRGKRVVGTDPVTGNDVYKYDYCGSARLEREEWFPWHCGKKGRFFKSKYK